jgi:hypothetical protein
LFCPSASTKHPPQQWKIIAAGMYQTLDVAQKKKSLQIPWSSPFTTQYGSESWICLRKEPMSFILTPVY